MNRSDRDYYETYWREEAGRAVEHDPLTPRRLSLFGELVKPGSRVLDAGAGSCGTTRSLRAAGFRAVGVELSREALGQASAAEVPRLQAGVEGPLPFRDGTFDAAYCAEVLEHLFDPLAAARELRRVVRPGGVVLASVPYHGLAKNLLVAAAGFDRHFDPLGQHIRFFTKATFQALLERAGLRVRRIETMGRFWPIPMDMVAVAERAP